MEYYDGTALTQKMDINGRKPEIYMVSGNKTGGKTTWFNKYMVERFKKKKEQFMIVNRWRHENNGIDQTIFSDIQDIFFPEDTMTSKIKANGAYAEIYLNGEICGYAAALSCADGLKKRSHIFNRVERMFMDEFQAESGRYVNNEVEKMHTLHTLVARGQGKKVRYVPLYMASNAYTLLNPYFIRFGLTEKINSTTRFIKGDGFVYQHYINQEAKEEQQQSGFNRAYAGTKVAAYANEAIYMDSRAYISRPAEKTRYRATIHTQAGPFAVLEGVRYIYITHTVDETNANKIAASNEAAETGYKVRVEYIRTLEQAYRVGIIRFQSIEMKDRFYQAIREARR